MGNQPSPLRTAIRWCEVDKVKNILDKAGDNAAHLINDDHSPDCILESCTRAIGNAFYYAVRFNRIEIIRILLEHGADPYSTGAFGETCLHLAARNNYVEVGKILLASGIDVRVTDDNGRYPIHSACLSVFNTSDFVEFLLKAAKDGDYVNVRDFQDRVPLHEAAFIGNTEVVHMLLSHGADVNAVDRSGNTPLHKAQRRPGVWQLLIEHGANRDVKNNYGLTPQQKLH